MEMQYVGATWSEMEEDLGPPELSEIPLILNARSLSMVSPSKNFYLSNFRPPIFSQIFVYFSSPLKAEVPLLI